MIIVPQTPITDASFDKWKCHRIDVEEEGESFYYYIIPLVEVDEEEASKLELLPTMFSSMSDEFFDENDKPIFTVRLFDDDLPEITTEEEVEILYKILTKKELLLN